MSYFTLLHSNHRKIAFSHHHLARMYGDIFIHLLAFLDKTCCPTYREIFSFLRFPNRIPWVDILIVINSRHITPPGIVSLLHHEFLHTLMTAFSATTTMVTMAICFFDHWSGQSWYRAAPIHISPDYIVQQTFAAYSPTP